MGQAWRSGADRTVERVVVGRRTAEQELDLVRLLEEEAPEEERERALPPSSEPAPAPAGEPTNAEMVEAVRDWIERSEEHTSELQSLMRISYAVFCLQKKNKKS